MQMQTDWIKWGIALVLLACWITAIQHDPFFWDTVQLASKHAHFFYENGLQWRVLPPDIDSGHPPFLGYYLALIWTIAGKTLPVSHWAMYPFLVGLVVQIIRLGRHVSQRWGWYLLPIILLDPVTAGQAALISPDIILLFALLWTINSIFSQKTSGLVAGGILLCLVSMRGMMCATAIGIWAMIITEGSVIQRLQRAVPLLPGAVLAAVFLWWHYQAAGWIGHFEGSTWAGAFQRVDLSGFVRNVAILGWRWLDMNRFFAGLILVFIGYQTGLRDFIKKHNTLFLLFFCLVVLLSPSALLYKNLSAHRYFMPVFAVLSMLVFVAVAHWRGSSRHKHILLTLLVLAMATGNFWVYPKGVSMDWDSTLAHLPYHRLRTEALAFIDQQQIPFSETGTTFPCLNTGEHLSLNGDQRKFAPLDLDRNQWVLASNILNDIDEPEYAVLDKEWIPVQQWAQGPVWIILYRRK